MMKTIKETLEQAREALEYIHEGANNQGPHTGISWRCVSNKAEPAIASLREALTSVPDWASEAIEQPQQEPVKAMHIGFDRLDNKQLVATYAVPVATNLYAPDLYTSPPAQPAQQERCHLCDCTGDIHSPDGEWRGKCPYCKHLAQPQQEPVAEVRQDMTEACPFCAADSYHLCGHFTPPPAQRQALPDAITDDSESPEYRTGWNECREAMKGMMK